MQKVNLVINNDSVVIAAQIMNNVLLCNFQMSHCKFQWTRFSSCTLISCFQ